MIKKIIKKWYYFIIVSALIVAINLGLIYLFGFDDNTVVKSFFLVLIILFVLYVLLGIYSFQKGIKSIILYFLISFLTFIVAPIFIIVISIFYYDDSPQYNYYSTDFYESELYKISDFKLSKNSKILVKSDSIHARTLGDYEHRLYFVMKLSSKDYSRLKKT
jgi:hypothetical protein